MKIYQAEILDGLQEAIASRVIARCEFGLLPVDNKVLASQNRDQPDLFYIDDAVLVSTNWNLNDDIFTKAEVWNARRTPLDKQFNHMHDDKFIIGHITKAVVVDYSGNPVPEDTPSENLPDFDISISSVIYKNIQDPEKAKIVAQLLEEIPQNKWCVSMECLFSDFDYGVLTPAGEHRTIARNDNSSFLTKHLRAYGGTGVYQGYKVGRILKNIAFSGVGSVDRPGNPRSIIRSFSFNGATASVQIFSEKVMSQELKEAVDTVSKAQYDELKQELASFKSAAQKASDKEMEEAKKAKCELETTLANLQKEVESVKALSDERANKIQALEQELAAQKAATKAAEDESEKMKEEKKAQCRLTKLVEAGVDSVKASELVAKFATANDEMFAEVVALNTNKTEADKKVVASDLDQTVDEKTVAQTQDNPTQEVAKAAADWFGSIFKKENK